MANRFHLPNGEQYRKVPDWRSFYYAAGDSGMTNSRWCWPSRWNLVQCCAGNKPAEIRLRAIGYQGRRHRQIRNLATRSIGVSFGTVFLQCQQYQSLLFLGFGRSAAAATSCLFRQCKRRGTALVGQRWIGPGIKQRLHRRRAPCANGAVKRRDAVPISEIGVCTGIEQQTNNCCL